MPRSTIEERSMLRDIKRNHRSLELKNAWFWVAYQAKSGLQLISEERNETGMLLDIFKENEYECYEIRSTGICIITVRPKNTKIMPVAYFKICPIYEPFAIVGLAPDRNLSGADELPLTSVIASVDELMFTPDANKNIVITL